MILVLLLLRLRAIGFGLYLSFLAREITLLRVDSLISGLFFSAFETVDGEIPSSFARSLIVTCPLMLILPEIV